MRPTNFEGNKTRLVGGFMNFIFNIWDVIRPIDELIFFKMVETTKQTINQEISLACGCICV
jgi:hypothetical protein